MAMDAAEQQMKVARPFKAGIRGLPRSYRRVATDDTMIGVGRNLPIMDLAVPRGNARV